MKATSRFKASLKSQVASCRAASLQGGKLQVTAKPYFAFPLILIVYFLLGVAMAQDESQVQDQWQGRHVFEAKGCVKCHPVYGEGGKAGPDLGERRFYGSYLRLAGIMWNHFPQMYSAMQKMGVSWCEFTNEEMSQLIAYLLYV